MGSVLLRPENVCRQRHSKASCPRTTLNWTQGRPQVLGSKPSASVTLPRAELKRFNLKEKRLRKAPKIFSNVWCSHTGWWKYKLLQTFWRTFRNIYLKVHKSPSQAIIQSFLSWCFLSSFSKNVCVPGARNTKIKISCCYPHSRDWLATLYHTHHHQSLLFHVPCLSGAVI